MATRRHYRRRFLNRPGFHAGAYAIAEVRLYRRDRRNDARVSASLAVADCSWVVDLDFNVHDEASARNALHKARVLREIVDDFVRAHESAVEEWRALQD